MVEAKQLKSVECVEVSTYKIGARGAYGAQAIVHQELKFEGAKDASVSSPSSSNIPKRISLYSKENLFIFQRESLYILRDRY